VVAGSNLQDEHHHTLIVDVTDDAIIADAVSPQPGKYSCESMPSATWIASLDDGCQ